MAISTFSELKTGVENWLGHTLFTARLGEFVALFEAWANRNLRARQQETSTTLTPSSGSATLPTDYLSTRRATWTGSNRVELQYVNPSYLQALFPDTPSGTPVMFTIEGTTFKLRPTSTTGIEFDYYAKIAALSDSATTNWLLTAHPDLYLFGSLVEACMFGDEDTRAASWLARRNSIAEEIQKLSNVSKGAGAIHVMSGTP
jgi:hypothetical protein